MALPASLRSRKSSESTRVPLVAFTRPKKALLTARRPMPKGRLSNQQRRVVARGPVSRIKTAAKLFGKEFGAGIGYWTNAMPKKQARRRPIR